MSSRADIESDLFSFEEKIFYISQAQRALIVFSLLIKEVDENWFNEYLDELYHDSFNTLFKSFYLESDDNYELYDEYRNNVIKGQIESLIEYICDFNEYDFELFLMKDNVLDKKYPKLYDSDFFCQKVSDEEKKMSYPLRVIYILKNVLKLLNNQEPLSLEIIREQLK